MVECKKNKAKVTESTCIARQGLLAHGDKLTKEGKHLKGLMASNYSDYKRSCGGCKIGEDLYKKNLEMEKITGKMKRCSRKQCLKEYPATEEYFGKNASAPDGLDYYCKECKSIKAKKVYNKKVGKTDSDPKYKRVAPFPEAKTLGPPIMKMNESI